MAKEAAAAAAVTEAAEAEGTGTDPTWNPDLECTRTNPHTL